MLTPRARVIENAVEIEYFITDLLSYLLDIKLDTSKSLGTKSGSISFIQKINILTDIESVSKQLRSKYEYFAQIRNQFAHNFEVKDFTICFNKISGLELGLKKFYPDVIDSNKEKYLEKLYSALYSELFKQTKPLYTQVVQSISKESELLIRKSYGECLLKALQEWGLKKTENTATVLDILFRTENIFNQMPPIQLERRIFRNFTDGDDLKY